MAKSMKKMLLLVALQSAAGAEAVPVPGTNAILARGVTPEPIVADKVQRQLIRPYKGNSGGMSTGVHRKISFEIELAGSGTAGKAPAYGPCLIASGFSETVTAGTDVTYNLTGDDRYLTIYVYLDGTLFKMTDSLGTVSLELNAKSIPVMKYEFLGRYHKAEEVAMPADLDVNYEAFMQPEVVGRTTTPTLTMHGHAGCTSQFSINLANQLAWRELINCSGPRSPDRQPTGQIVMEMPKVSTIDWADVVVKGQKGPLNVVHGITAGNIVELQMPAVQPGAPTIQDAEGDAMISMAFDINPVHGNDELTIIVR